MAPDREVLVADVAKRVAQLHATQPPVPPFDPGPLAPRRRRPPAELPAGGDDPLREIAPSVYIETLTGREIPAHGTIRCPLPDHRDRSPSCGVYGEPERGWYCHGCHRGGSIYDLAGHLWGIAPLRGTAFLEVRRRLLDVFASHYRDAT